MKPTQNKILMLVVVAFALTPSYLLASENFEIDSAHSYILFKIKHLNVGNSYGRFSDPTGSFTWDDANPVNSNFTVMVPAANVDTDNDQRDKHLRSADFFDVAQHATIAFKSTAVKKTGNDQYEVHGQLTLMGQSHPITAVAAQTGHGQDPWGNYRRGFETTFTIKRSQWGMDFMRSGLGDEVEITVSVEGVRQ